MPRVLLLPAASLLAACAATLSPAPAVSTQLRVVAPAAFDARGFADEHSTPAECEQSARSLQKTSRDEAWSALRACVERAHWPHGAFTALQSLVDGAWDEELKKRPDAPALVARVVAARGGDVDGDLPLAQRSRVPIFSLHAALEQPEVYKGRYVLLRGSLADLRAEAGLTTALLRESALRSATREFETGTKARTEHQESAAAKGDLRTAAYGDLGGHGSVSQSERTDHATIARRFENEKVVTGRQALGRLAQPDPFLEPGREFVFLARFDGVRPADDDSTLGLLTVVSYFEPAPLLVQ
jgi:hypothetical protein